MLSFYILGAKKIFSILKKIFFIFTVYFVIIFLFINFTSNNSIKTERNFEKKINKYDDKILKDEKLTNNPYGKIYIQIYKGSNCFLFGQLCDNNNLDEQNYKNSFFGKFNTLFESLYLNQPASFSFWASNSLNKAGFIPNVFALDNSRQATTGIGFQSLKSFYILWENFRNLSFLIITLVLVTIGFMIMFRTKINPQTVISIENALPKIIISMILITFSYPIAGLMIDLMYVSLPIVAGLFKNILYMPPDDLAKSINLSPIIPSKTSGIFLNNIIFELISNIIKIINPYDNRSILDLTFDQFINNNAFSIVFDWLNFNLYTKAINDIISGAFLSQNIIFQEFFKIIISIIGLFLISALINPVGEYLSNILGNLGEGAGIGIPRLIFLVF
ncbi:MAG: hypothetical protein NZM02_01415 [Patescibacteria group bacterium]|nr:hypothetical protein [Patescibacteria group bacterium]